MKYYPLIVNDLLTVLKKSKSPLKPSQIIDVIEQDRAWLVVCFQRDTKKYLGFVIVSQEPVDQFTGGRSFLVWFAICSEPGASKVVFEELEKMASELGYTDIVMRSSRPGWERLAKAYGFSLKERIYMKNLEALEWRQSDQR
jgi:hypothetical protein